MLEESVNGGYGKTGVPDLDIDKNMLGKGKGASIFTSRGKERYEFALKIIWRATEMEKEIHKQEPIQEIKFEEAETVVDSKNHEEIEEVSMEH